MSTSTERVRRMRERRKAALQPPEDGPVLRDAAGLLGPAVEATIAALDLGESDAAVVRLARGYAKTIDEARDPSWGYRWLGPLLLDCLEQLGGTPAARGRLEKPKSPGGPSRLDQLRQARAAGPGHRSPL